MGKTDFKVSFSISRVADGGSFGVIFPKLGNTDFEVGFVFKTGVGVVYPSGGSRPPSWGTRASGGGNLPQGGGVGVGG